MIDLSALEYRINELERRLANVVLIGTVSEADYTNAFVRVQVGNITTAWLPWLTRRASNAVDWWAPEIGEQVMVISPSGELAQGVVMPALYSDTHPAPSTDQHICRTDYGDGSYVEYDATAHKLTVAIDGGDAVVTTTANITATAGGDVSVHADGDVTADGANVILNGGAAGGVVCQSHTCAFTGSPHPQASGTVTAGN